MTHSSFIKKFKSATYICMSSLLIFCVTPAFAEEPSTSDKGLCAYRPSNIIGGFWTSTATGIAGSTAAAGVGLKSAGFYTLKHSITGLLMVGSTASGTSAAGTTGIIASTAGGVGTTAAFVMSPVVIVGGIVFGVGVGGFEGYCYLTKGDDE